MGKSLCLVGELQFIIYLQICWVFMCQGPEAEGRGRGNFLARDSVGVLAPCPGWDVEEHVDESGLKYLHGKTRILGSPFPEYPLGLAQFVAV